MRKQLATTKLMGNSPLLFASFSTTLLAMLVVIALDRVGIASADEASDVRDAFTAAEIGFIPAKKLTVTYAGGKTVESGKTTLTEEETKEKPTLSWDGSADAPGTLYTLMMLDPDAPSPKDPIYRHWLHWLVVNIPQSANPGAALGSGEEYALYEGPQPPEGSHRYVLLVFKQSGRINDADYATPIAVNDRDDLARRGKWNPAVFARTHGLQRPPVAGNLFTLPFQALPSPGGNPPGGGGAGGQQSSPLEERLRELSDAMQRNAQLLEERFNPPQSTDTAGSTADANGGITGTGDVNVADNCWENRRYCGVHYWRELMERDCPETCDDYFSGGTSVGDYTTSDDDDDDYYY